MATFPGGWYSSSEFRVPAAITSLTHLPVVTAQISISGTTNWPSASLAIYVPVIIPTSVMVVQLGWFNGSTTTGNVDVGIYTEDLTRIVSSGSTAQSGSSALQYVNITDTTIGPGLFYFALVNDATSRVGVCTTTATLGQAEGMAEQASASPLPATATFAAFGQVVFPFVVASLDTRV